MSLQPTRPPGATISPNRRLRAALKLAFVGALLFSTGGPSVQAEDENPAVFFRADRERLNKMQQRPAARIVVQRPTHLIRRGATVRGFAREVPVSPAREQQEGAPTAQPGVATPPPDEPVRTADAPAPPPAAPVAPLPAPVAPAVASKPNEATFSVLVVGDSLGQMLSQGLTEAFADQPEVSILRKARENTGLVRDDYFDWVKGVHDLLASTEKINIAVIMVGSNDRQQLRDGTASLDFHQPRWRELYGDRVEAIAKAFKDRKIPLVWVGLPVMKSERFSDDMESFNEIYQDRAGKAGATFVDTWEAFVDDRGQFAAYGPDVNGQFQKLRAGDGVHFTRPGARKLAHFVESEIRHAIEDAHPQTQPLVAALPAAPAAEIAARPAAPQKPAGPGPLVALPAPAAPPAVIIPVRPLAGPVAPLTGPAVSPGGVLATRAAPAGTAAGSQAILERAIVQGQPLEARPGRADDFSWPRN